MRDARNQLVREIIRLVRYEGDEFEAFDETGHFVLALHINLQLRAEQVIELVCTASCCHDFDPFTHLLERNAIDIRRALDEILDELDTFIDVIGLEAFKV